jgi:hypothetical protein
LEATEYTRIDPEVIRHGRLSVYKSLQCITFNGEYELTSSYKIYVVANMVWRTKNQEEKDKLFKNFLKNSKKTTINNVVTSSNGLYKVPNKAQKFARKREQVKRSRSEKTK